MPDELFIYQSTIRKLFNILIVIIFLSSCSTHSPAPVSDKSRTLTNIPKSHTVVPGDTLFSIAWRYGLKYEALAKYNGISAPYVIRPSQVIRLDMPTNKSSAAGGKDANSKAFATPQKSVFAEKNDIDRKKNKTTTLAKADKKSPAGSAPQWRWPVRGAVLSSFQGNNGLNKGIDLGGKLGEPVLAAAGGQVVYSGSGLRGYGKLLIVKHNEIFLSAYAHNDRLLVKEGDFVKAGQVIADMGSSGTDRVKLHFEIRRDGTPVDPLKFLPRR